MAEKSVQKKLTQASSGAVLASTSGLEAQVAELKKQLLAALSDIAALIIAVNELVTPAVAAKKKE